MSYRAIALLLALLALNFSSCGSDGSKTNGSKSATGEKLIAGPDEPSVSVKVILQSDDGSIIESISIPNIPWHNGMTMVDALNIFTKRAPEAVFKTTGSGENLTVIEMGTSKGSRKAEGNKKWVYEVTGDRTQRPLAAQKLDREDVILWKFE